MTTVEFLKKEKHCIGDTGDTAGQTGNNYLHIHLPDFIQNGCKIRLLKKVTDRNWRQFRTLCSEFQFNCACLQTEVSAKFGVGNN